MSNVFFNRANVASKIHPIALKINNMLTAAIDQSFLSIINETNAIQAAKSLPKVPGQPKMIVPLFSLIGSKTSYVRITISIPLFTVRILWLTLVCSLFSIAGRFRNV
jgi:hypothetical protein